MAASPPAPPSNQTSQKTHLQKSLASFGLMALLAIPVILLVAIKRSSGVHTLMSGQSIPTLVLSDVNSGDWSLMAMRGKRAAILFFSVDCPHCQREMVIFNEAQKSLWTDVEFVAISMSDRLKTRTFVQATKTLARVLVDEKGEASRLFGISELPTLFLVDRDQEVRRVIAGEQTRGAMLHRLFEFGGKNPVPIAHSGNASGGR